ncbi:hypothetical protein RRG08_062250 [Elysia crispata]|uniref:Uncharacterized protein n=1 Tax=Elysia crispata TaxID=231223 RepID=A0AAE0YH29_9GAST|nr:hypothetical protein RRG08_062250 [Elysia crispata]
MFRLIKKCNPKCVIRKPQKVGNMQAAITPNLSQSDIFPPDLSNVDMSKVVTNSVLSSPIASSPPLGPSPPQTVQATLPPAETSLEYVTSPPAAISSENVTPHQQQPLLSL